MPNSAERQKELVLTALDQYERPLLRYATRLLGGDEDLARDAVQHSFLKLCEKPTVEFANNLAPWLYTVCRNRVMDIWRQTKREPVVEVGQSDDAFARELGPSVQFEKSAMLNLVQELISQLAASEREVAGLWSQGFSCREMSQVTGRTEGAIRVCLHRAIKSLRQHPAIKNWIAADEFGAATTNGSSASNKIGQQQ